MIVKLTRHNGPAQNYELRGVTLMELMTVLARAMDADTAPPYFKLMYMFPTFPAPGHRPADVQIFQQSPPRPDSDDIIQFKFNQQWEKYRLTEIHEFFLDFLRGK